MLFWDAPVLLIWLFRIYGVCRGRTRSRSPASGRGRFISAKPAEVALRVRSDTPAMIHVSLQDDVPDSLAAAPWGRSRARRRVQKRHLLCLCRSAAATFPGKHPSSVSGPPAVRGEACRRRLKQTVRVYPSLRESKQYLLYLMRSRQIEIERRLKHTVGAGREFESLATIATATTPRDICWTATARRGKLVTRTYQVERSQPVAIVVDAGRLLLAKVQPRTQPITLKPRIDRRGRPGQT